VHCRGAGDRRRSRGTATEGVTVAHQGRTQTMSWLLLTITAIGYIAVVSFSSIANAETADQEKCGEEAKRTFEELENAYAAELNKLQLTIEVVSSDYKSH
jgi:hypothetical protein